MSTSNSTAKIADISARSEAPQTENEDQNTVTDVDPAPTAPAASSDADTEKNKYEHSLITHSHSWFLGKSLLVAFDGRQQAVGLLLLLCPFPSYLQTMPSFF